MILHLFLSETLNLRNAHSLLHVGTKDWWNFVTKKYSPAENRAVTWEQFVNKLKEESVLLVKRDQLTQEYLSLKLTIELVTDITNMFIERALFFPCMPL